MAHNLNIVNGKAAFYSLKESAWHKLGQVVDRPVDDPEVLRLAGLDWEAIHAPLTCDENIITSHVAIQRSDTKDILGVVSPSYAPVQNKDLLEWVAGLRGFADVTVETAGALGLGETVWVMARCNGLIFDGAKDGGIVPYMLLANGHNGLRKLTIMPTTVRVVCQNTLRMSGANRSRKQSLADGFNVRHTSGIAQAMKDIQEAYAKTTEAWKATTDALEAFTKAQLTDTSLIRMFTEPFIAPRAVSVLESEPDDMESLMTSLKDSAQSESARAATIRMARESRLREVLASGTCAINGMENTVYGALQAVTEFVDHETPVKSKEGEAESRLMSANFGGVGDKVKARAWELALELVG